MLNFFFVYLQKKQKKLEKVKIPNGNPLGEDDPFAENDDDVAKIAKELEAKYVMISFQCFFLHLKVDVLYVFRVLEVPMARVEPKQRMMLIEVLDTMNLIHL